MPDANTLEVRILEKDYLVACPIDKRIALEGAANHLDTKMREIRSSGKVHGTERIAVMAALNMTYELLEKDSDQVADEKTLLALSDKLDFALKEQP
ncbi:MAG: cell division protein ZapA [Oleiphilaceae bacterium]|jgi:cell division protein ZapA